MKDSRKDCPLIHWYCSKQCNKLAPKFLSGMTQIQKQVDNLTEQVAQVDMKITEVQEGKFTPKMIDTVKEISKEEAHVRPLDVKLEEFKGILESHDREHC